MTMIYTLQTSRIKRYAI